MMDDGDIIRTQLLDTHFSKHSLSSLTYPLDSFSINDQKPLIDLKLSVKPMEIFRKPRPANPGRNSIGFDSR